MDATEQVRALVNRSEYLAAFDRAREGLAEDSDNVELGWLSVLALARSGATDRAEQELELLRLEQAPATGRLAEDIAALRARLSKDRALSSSGSTTVEWARRAADEYEAVHRRFGGHYSCVNAATMALMAGEAERSRRLASRVLEIIENEDGAGPEEQYWREASRAEAALILGKEDEARQALGAAAALPAGNLSMYATTKRQLQALESIIAIDPTILDELPIPTVAHYTGHMFVSGSMAEAGLAGRISDCLDDLDVGVAYGALAGGADILIAEAILDRGAELNVVLPGPAQDFLEHSVRPAGEPWVARFESCLSNANSVFEERATAGALDEAMFAFGSHLAMGYAVIRARAMSARPAQIAVWDGVEATGPAGTAADVARWEKSGHHMARITLAGVERLTTMEDQQPATAHQVRAMLFADIRGFSELTEPQLGVFVDDVLGELGATIDRFGERVLYRNTWGDGLYLVLDSIDSAARCALDLQETIAGIDLTGLGLPDHLRLRIGGHAGPIFEAADPIRHTVNFYGTHVTRTARIEPRTPEGAVYVTEAFAALLAIDTAGDMVPEYVGHIPAAKDYGTFPMYVLRARN